VGLFAYTARGADGKLVEARLEASSRAEVASELVRSGRTPIRIEAVEAEPEPQELRLRKRRIGQDDLILFCRQMHRLSHAGVPLIRGLTGLAESTRNASLRRVLEDLIDALRGGRELSEALRAHPKVFPALFTSIIGVGENTGRLDTAFEQMAHYLEFDRENRRRMKTAMRYPMVVLGTIGAALIVVNVWVIPAFAAAFAEFGAELPWATRLLIGFSSFLISWWPLLLAGAAGAILGVRSFVGTPEGRLIWDRLRLRLPIVGSIVYRGTLARFARSFSITSASGVPILSALEVVSGALDNAYLTSRLADLVHSVERGETLTRAAAATGIFDALVLQMMAVGEETGMLSEMFQEISDTYESEVEYDLKRMSELIEPLLILGVAGVVLVLALGVYLPMWNLAGAALH